ncbi:hypothetical protein EYF80_065279 [Liparis tanakae]|uniref:Uncharacterized protein n=1 Tax=Liparis tanakae TaxID=230148 RepID=A0A4Z2E734_9TELE|nr:hypothetical protein EYF80_065279 [Liparis tanakae]
MWRSVLPLLVAVSLFLPPGRSSTQEGLWQDYKHGGQGPESQFCSWDCLVFTLQWPGAFCQSLHEGSLCWIPQSVDSWTIHGLWPGMASNCCSCWPMFPSDVQVSPDGPLGPDPQDPEPETRPPGA